MVGEEVGVKGVQYGDKSRIDSLEKKGRKMIERQTKERYGNVIRGKSR